MSIAIRFVIKNVYMGKNHRGLQEEIDKQRQLNPLFAQAIKPAGSLVLFVNTRKTAAKLFTVDGNVVAYLRMDKPITAADIDQIPAAFGGDVVCTNAVRGALRKLLALEKETKTVAYA